MIEYYGNNDYRDYLMHYGVKGMKWGKRLKSAAYDVKNRFGMAIRREKVLGTDPWERTVKEDQTRGMFKTAIESDRRGDGLKASKASIDYLKEKGYIKKKRFKKGAYKMTEKGEQQDAKERAAIDKHERTKFDLAKKRVEESIEKQNDAMWDEVKKRYAKGTVSKEYLMDYAYNSPRYRYANDADRILAATNNNEKAQRDGQKRTRKETLNLNKSSAYYNKTPKAPNAAGEFGNYQSLKGESLSGNHKPKDPNETLSRQDSNFSSVTTNRKKKRRP